jgi:hypothetical protein
MKRLLILTIFMTCFASAAISQTLKIRANVEIVDLNSYSCTGCSRYFDMSLSLANGKTLDLFKSQTIPCTMGNFTFSKVITIDYDYRKNPIQLIGQSTTCSNGINSKSYTSIPSKWCCQDLIFKDPIIFGNNCNSTLTLTFEPTIVAESSTNTTVYHTANVTAQVTSGFPDDSYEWYYMIGNGSWAAISGASGANINIPLSTFTSTTSNLVGEMLYIKAKVCDTEINFIYSVKMEPPGVTATSSVAPKCSGDADGQLSLTFNRKLEDKEFLSFRYTNVSSLSPGMEKKIYPPGKDITSIEDAYNQNSDFTVLLDGFESGTYTYTITDFYNEVDQNNTSKGTFTIEDNAPVIATVTPPTAYSDNHDLQLNVTGGTASYQYTFTYNNWTDFIETTSSPVRVPADGKIVNLATGHYKLSVTDTNECVAIFEGTNSDTTYPFNVIYPLEVTLSPTVILCNGDEGQLTANVTGGYGTYTYSWENSNGKLDESSNTLTNLEPEEYKLTVSDHNSHTAATSYKFTEPDPVAAGSSSAQIMSNACYGESSGAISINPSGGTGTYLYQWSGPNNFTSSDQNITNLVAGYYELRLTDSNSCSANNGNPTSYYVSQPSPITVSNAYTISTDYPGEGGGSIGFQMTGGTPNASSGYTYSWVPSVASSQISTSWYNNVFTQSLSNLTSGNYIVTITDQNLCSFRQSFTVTNPSLLAAEISSTNISCKGNSNGSLGVKASGGKPGSGNTYKITWYSSGVLLREDKFLANTSQLTQLAPGIYSVTIEDSKGHTINRGPISITEPDALTVSPTVTDVKCFEANTGSIALEIAGGTTPYQAVWSSGQTTMNIFSLPSGDYSVTITDAQGCTATATSTITQPASPIALSMPETEHPLRIGETGNISEVILSGGVPDYTYRWIGPTGSEIATGNGNTTSLTAVTAGSYTLIASDSNGCTLSATYTLKDPLPLSVSLTETQVISCNNSNDAKIYAKATGGALVKSNKYIYEWYKFNALNDSTLLLKSSSDSIKSNVSPGNYFVWIEDRGGSRLRSTNLQITEPDILTATSTVTDVFCYNGNDGAILFEIQGGTAPYQIERTSNGATVSQTQQTAGAGQFAGLIAGNYYVVVTDSHGCSSLFDQIIGQPAEKLTVNTTKVRGPTSIGLSTGIIKGQINGGTPDYSSRLKNSLGTVVCEFTGNIIDISGLAQGTYSLIVQDNHFDLATSQSGCQTEVTYVLKDPDPLTATLTQTESVLCYGATTGALEVAVTGGIELDEGGYYYTWYSIDSGVRSALGSTTTNNTASLLPAGKYEVKVTDQFNNMVTSNPIEITQPALLVLSGSTQSVSCNEGSNGRLSIVVSGGVSPYSGIMQYKTTLQNFSMNAPDGKDFQGLAAGVYTITITDYNLCASSFTSEIEQPADPVSISLKGVQPTGAGLRNGSISAAISGGTPPYSFTWENGDGQLISSGTGSETILSNLGKGLYSLTVTDANYPGNESDDGCQTSSLYQLSEPAPLVAKISQTVSILCKGDAAGALKVAATGGVPASGYQYKWYQEGSASDSLWLNNRISASESGLSAGTYFVWVIDVNNNKARTASITITEPDELNVVHQFQNISCYGGANGFISLSVSGGVSPYSYRWSNNDTSSTIEKLSTGNYQVTVTDSNGCQKTLTQTLTSPDAPVSLTGIVTHPTAYLASDGRITVSVSGGVAPYQYNWTKADGSQVETDASQNAINLSDGYYNLTVTDSNFNDSFETSNARGCLQEYSFHVVQPSLLKVEIIKSGPVICHGESNGSLKAQASGGVPFSDGSYRYQWIKTDGQSPVVLSATSSQVDKLQAGTYEVTLTDANGITRTATHVLTDPEPLSVSFNQSVSPANSIEAVVSGGIPPYSYMWNTGSTATKIDQLADGQYNVWVTDALGCNIVRGTTIGNTVYDPTLPVINLSVVQPTCAGICDGFASASISGGKAPYAYDWGNGTTSDASAQNLCDGTYLLKVTDAAQKTVTRPFIIKSPESFTIPIESSVSICKGEIYEADATVSIAGATYQWSSDGGFISSDAKIDITDAGKYTVTVTTPKGCMATATIDVEENFDPGIDLDYALTTQAAAGRTIVIVNTSLYNDGSEYTGNVNWILPDAAKVVSTSNESAQIIIETPGNYEIGIETRTNNCKLQKIKNITITPYNGETEDKVGSLLNVVVYPNPNTGNFNVKVEMDEQKLIKLFLISASNYGIIWSKILSGSDQYDANVTIGQPVAGLYFILVVTGDGESTIRKVIVM